ncbi:Gfo/Idh/MocA family protein [Dictyobacter arantiisoli]|uniref:Oxidoreductase n=1 Tax=Dictyobacter arantiisoli TaxID=2014874 RepID=A0A5A5T844_9CHLR|nr:Gfo/Idh/MocA family oxidoreductase [Dictyobacter arantiisoli]GCF07572.1 oxidoreductase [Dictyobacter arantiisoli]
MTTKMRFGIVGCGVIGPTHAEAIQTLPDAELVAIADIVPEKAQKMADKFHVTAYTDLQTMLEQEQLDIVDVCTPSGLHGKHACQIMRAGSHVIIEKPMEIQHERIAEILAVQRETGKKLAVISQHRFDESSQRLHELVGQKELGRIVMGNAAIPWWRSQQYYDSGAWRGTWELDGGGVLMNQSIHSIDILQWLMGRVKSIYAYTDTLVHKMETEDAAVAILRFENGALGTIVATTGAYPGVTTRIEVFGERGSAVIEDDRLKYLRLASEDTEEAGPYGGGKKHQADVETDQKDTASDPAALQATTHARQIADMMRAIREDGTPLVDGYAASHPVEIILGIYESARTGKEVTLS